MRERGLSPGSWARRQSHSHGRRQHWQPYRGRPRRSREKHEGVRDLQDHGRGEEGPHGPLIRWLVALGGELTATYEAGPTGYVLAREIQQAGIRCVV